MKSLIKTFLPDKEVSKNAGVYSLGTYSSKIISLIIFPIVAVQLGLSDTGKYDLVISIVVILGPIFSLQAGDAAYRWLQNSDLHQKKIGVTTSLALLIAAIILATLISAILYWVYAETLILIGYCILVTQMSMNTMMQIVRGNGQVRLYTASVILRSVVFTLGELWAIFYTENKLENVLAAFALANFSSLLICLWKGNYKQQVALNMLRATHTRAIIKYAYPLVINSLGWLLLLNINKFLIPSSLGYEMSGVYTIAERLTSPIYLLGLFYYFSSQDFFLNSPDFHKNKKGYRGLIIKVSVITFAISTFLVIGAYVLLPLLFSDLTMALDFLPIMALSKFVIVVAIYLSIPYLSDKKTFSMAATTVLGVLITVIISLSLIGSIGIWSVFLGVLTGAIFVLLLRLIHAFKFFNQPDYGNTAE